MIKKISIIALLLCGSFSVINNSDNTKTLLDSNERNKVCLYLKEENKIVCYNSDSLPPIVPFGHKNGKI